MNNNQFRRLVSDTPARQDGDATATTVKTTPSALGTRKSSFMPMTPRTVKGGIDVDFARQVRERNAAQQPKKKFKSSAPKGVKYGSSYTDRAKARAEDEDGEDDRAERIKALEEQMKLGQISEDMFEEFRDRITGGDIGSTHLVKGLDRKLLERVRRGEDVLGAGDNKEASEPPPDVDDELDKLEDKDVEAIKREKVEKKGIMASPPIVGVKRSRDEIMAELKAQRKAAAEAKAAQTLDSRWKRVGEKEKSRVEIDSKGREVRITVDEDGIVKKKVRKVVDDGQGEVKQGMEMPDASKPVLGADVVVPEAAKQLDDDEDDDIFEGVGTAYNPLGDDDEDDDSDEENDDESDDESTSERPEKDKSSMSSPKAAVSTENIEETAERRPATASRNYFKDDPSNLDEPAQDRLAGVQDLLKKAAKMDSSHSLDNEEGLDREAQEARLKKRAQMLSNQDRDMDDMDMGFGGSRYDDGGDEDGTKVKLSEWKGGADEGWEEDDGGKGGGKKRRKPKKRKGDVNNAEDIFRVIEGRKAGGNK